ncbi:MAG TPA: bifunctional DNA primase/polymerase [Pelagibacterium sp.]|uniref:bifunctional DNA primase/polymerase n=1 Tax=Pelagibacterium sp. TaxID=1967288 RepID=UPI002B5423DB|nr:bifunctional DNA primase/polymerase [Pelagibacterium sp.]HWJ89075.1 bifunctional DNA primase/polymerase [Pelagibacterium sp.]
MTLPTTPHAYASTGWPVFPCRPGEETHPETGEILTPKSPYTTRGFRSASRMPRIIDRWWADHPDAMIGIPTGEPTGVWVLDVDVTDGKQGEATLAALVATNGPLPVTREARTASGGRHIYFQHHPGVRNRGSLGPGLDVRGDGGFVIAPGSQLADGRAYEWLNDEQPAPAPQWLLDLVLPSAVTTPAQPFSYQPGQNEPYVERAVEAELSALAATPSGGRGQAVNRSAYSLGTLVGAGALSRADAEQGLWQAAVACGVVAKDGEAEIHRKIKRGLDAGMQQPRHIPEREEEDLERWMPHKLLAKLQAKAQQVQAAKEPAGKPAATGVEPQPEPDNSGSKPASTPPPAPATDDLPVKITPFQWTDPQLLPRREFVYGTHLVRKYVSVTVSPGGIGKTSLTIAEALAMVSGRPLLGTKPPRRLNVWLFNAEDPRDEMDRRIMAAAVHYKLKPRDLDGLFLDSGREQSIIVAHEDKRSGTVIQWPIVDAVIEHIKSNKIDVMVIDPFVSTHGVSENDNGAIDKVAKLWAKIADVTNCAIEVVHHVRKSDGRDVTVEDSRGAVSLLAAARSARVLNRMSDEQASAAGLSPTERFSYFSVTRGKSNLSAMSGDLEWRRLQSVPLGNGAGLTKPQDHAGVVTEWQWPGKADLVDSVSSDKLRRICTEIDMADYRENEQAKDWVGQVVAYVLGLDASDRAEKRRIKSMVTAWIEDGTFKIVEGRDPVRRTAKKFVKSAQFSE